VAVRYRVDFENHSGTVVAIFQDFRSLNFTAAISRKGSYQLTLSGFDSQIDAIREDYLMRVWMDDVAEGIDWTNVFVGIHKTFNDTLTQTGNRTYTSYGPSLEELLEKTYILYPSGTAQSTKSGVASTVMHAYVAQNVGPDGTASRYSAAQNLLGAATDPVLGGQWSGSASAENLLETMQAISDFTREKQTLIANKVDFRVNYLGGYTFQFEAGQIGADRTTDGLVTGSPLNGAGNAPIIFAAELGNILSESRSESRYNEINTVVGLGRNLGENRTVQVAQDTNSASISPLAVREGIINASQNTTTAGVLAAAEGKVKELVSKERFSFEPRKGAQVLFRDYFLGDFVTAESYRTRTRVNKQLRSLTINVSGGRDQIEQTRMEFEDV